jgi:hypothetical protein
VLLYPISALACHGDEYGENLAAVELPLRRPVCDEAISLNAEKAWWQLLEERQKVATLQQREILI